MQNNSDYMEGKTIHDQPLDDLSKKKRESTHQAHHTAKTAPARMQQELKTVSFQPGERMGIRFTGNVITKVVPDSQADKLGVCVGWIILKVNGNKMGNDSSAIDTAIEVTKNKKPTEISFSLAAPGKQGLKKLITDSPHLKHVTRGIAKAADTALSEVAHDGAKVTKVAAKFLLSLDISVYARSAEFAILLCEGAEEELLKPANSPGAETIEDEIKQLFAREQIPWSRWATTKEVWGETLDTHYLLVTCADPRLEKARSRHIQTRWMKGGNIMALSDAKVQQMSKGIPFTAADRLLYLGSILNDEMKLIKDYPKVFQKIIALHDHQVNHQLIKENALQNYVSNLSKIRDHFGDEVGWFNAWTAHATVWMVPPAAIGFILHIIWGYSEYAYYRAVPFFCMFTLIWVSLMLRFWERQKNVLTHRWNLHTADIEIYERHGWKENALKRTNRITKKTHYYVPPCKALWKSLVIIPIVLVTLIIVYGLGFLNMTGYYTLKFYDCKNRQTGKSKDVFYCDYDPAVRDSRYGVNVGALTFFALAIPDILFALFVDVVVYELFGVIAEVIADWEAPQYQSQYDRSLVWKMYGVYFASIFGYYWSLAYMFVPYGDLFQKTIPFMKNVNINPTPDYAAVYCSELNITNAAVGYPENVTLTLTDYTVSEWINIASLDKIAWASCGRKFRGGKFVRQVQNYFVVVQFVNILVKSLLPFLLNRLFCFGLFLWFSDCFWALRIKQKKRDDEKEGTTPERDQKGTTYVRQNSDKTSEAGGLISHPSEISEDQEVFAPGTKETIPAEQLDRMRVEVRNVGFSTFIDYSEISCQLSFFTFFVGAYPLMPVLILLNNTVEMYTDKFKMSFQKCRITPVRRKGIGAWFEIFTFISRIGATFNMLVLLLTLNIGLGWGMPFYYPSTNMINLVLIALGLERCVMLCQATFIKPIISDVTLNLQDEIDAKKDVCNQILIGNLSSKMGKTMRRSSVLLDAEVYEPCESYNLEIVIHKAENLSAKDFWTRSSDPFVTLVMKRSVSLNYQTRTKWRTLSPEWQEKICWHVPDAKYDTLLIDIYDDDRGDLTAGLITNDHLGALEIPLAEFLGEREDLPQQQSEKFIGVKKKWFTLREGEKKSTENKESAKIQLSLRLTPMDPISEMKSPSRAYSEVKLSSPSNLSPSPRLSTSPRLSMQASQSSKVFKKREDTDFLWGVAILVILYAVGTALGPSEGRQVHGLEK